MVESKIASSLVFVECEAQGMGVRVQIAGEVQVTKGPLVSSAISLSLLPQVVRSHWRVSDGQGVT